jgi:hypothetical protein
MKRDCIERCGRMTTGTRCRPCEAARERKRGTPSQRGYGAAHQAARKALAAQLPDLCGYCHKVIRLSDKWVAAHVVDGQPDMGWMVAHPDCNERAKVRR